MIQNISRFNKTFKGDALFKVPMCHPWNNFVGWFGFSSNLPEKPLFKVVNFKYDGLTTTATLNPKCYIIHSLLHEEATMTTMPMSNLHLSHPIPIHSITMLTLSPDPEISVQSIYSSTSIQTQRLNSAIFILEPRFKTFTLNWVKLTYEQSTVGLKITP